MSAIGHLADMRQCAANVRLCWIGSKYDTPAGRLEASWVPGMDDATLLSCIAWVAHGFEIVQSIFPNWKFSAANSVVADAMHGALLVGPHHDIGSRAGEWLRTLASFNVELYCDGQLMDRGHASNVLEGPLSAMHHLMELLARDPDNLPLAAGEIVSTGNVDARAAGEGW